MNYKILLINIFFVLISFSVVDAQRLLKISVSVNGRTESLSFISRNGISFVSAKEICGILGGNHFYNRQAAKVEMKYNQYRLKVTARSQFYIITNITENSQFIYQIPISTFFHKDDIFIPLTYSLPYLNNVFDKELLFDEEKKHLSVTAKPTEAALDETLEQQKDEDDLAAEPAAKPKEKISSPYTIYGIEINELTNGTLIRLKSQKPIYKFSSSIQEGKLRLFISNASIAPNILSGLKPSGFIKNAELKNVQGNKQIEFLLKDGYAEHEATKDVDTDDLIITIHNKIFSAIERDFSKEIDDWKFDAVVIDAGHGGKDPGAIGIKGAKEKDINLAVALKLGEMISKSLPDVNVIYTRSTDKFVELYKRGKIANENNGKLFISIHCNSAGKKSSTRGFEVYLLRPGKTQQAIEIAELENSVIKLEDNPDRYQKLTDENFILVSMAHSAYMRYSEKFSDMLNSNWLKQVRGIPSRGVKQAGFYVLVGASMPGVLVEAGFLSNEKDEEYLKSERGQKEVATALFQTVKEYKQYYTEQIQSEVNQK